MVTDPIADMITRIKNAGMAEHTLVTIPFSKIKSEIANALVRAGYLKSVSVIEGAEGKKTPFKFLEIEVLYKNSANKTGRKEPRLGDAWRVSKVSRRIYSGIKKMKPIRQGYGVSILSTTKGILTDKEAKKENVGGEVLLTIW